MKKGFVFSSMGFLLVIPAMILAASFLNMMEYGGFGTRIVISGDNIYYHGQNAVDFLQDAARDGYRNDSIENVTDYSAERGLNLTIEEVNCTLARIILSQGDDLEINRTFELKLGSLEVEMNLTGNMSYFDNRYVFQRGTLINISSNVTYNNGSDVDGAVVTNTVLGSDVASVDTTNLYTSSSLIAPGADTGDYCTNAENIGNSEVVSEAVRTCYYDGEASEDIRVVGISTLAFEPVIRRLKNCAPGINYIIDYEMQVTDEFGDGVREMECTDTTLEYPDLNFSLSLDGAAPVRYFFGTNITTGGISGGKKISAGWYSTNASLCYDSDATRTGTLCVISPDFIDSSGTKHNCHVLEEATCSLVFAGGENTLTNPLFPAIPNSTVEFDVINLNAGVNVEVSAVRVKWDMVGATFLWGNSIHIGPDDFWWPSIKIDHKSDDNYGGNDGILDWVFTNNTKYFLDQNASIAKPGGGGANNVATVYIHFSQNMIGTSMDVDMWLDTGEVCSFEFDV
jgi:hypothetical protein